MPSNDSGAKGIAALVTFLLSAAGLIFAMYSLAGLLIPGCVYSLPSISIHGPQADWVKFSDWEIGRHSTIKATVQFTPPKGPTLFNKCKITYEYFDRKGIKLGGRELGVPEISSGERAKVEFHTGEGTRTLKVNVYSVP